MFIHKLNDLAIARLVASLAFSTLAVISPVFLPFRPTVWANTESYTSEIETLQQSNQHWIQVDLSRQRLIAWEGNTPVYAVVVSTGKPETPTLTGVFTVQYKFQTARMQGDDYDVPDVPFTMYYDGNYAIHGAYWHHNFGTPVSHGCVNVAVDHAEWLFNWSAVGTPVIVHN
jgi:lipoprotein-anchoring transpeptidase ErfK/SrfK